MNTMNRISLVSVISAALLIVLSACSGREEDSVTEAETATEGAPAPAQRQSGAEADAVSEAVRPSPTSAGDSARSDRIYDLMREGGREIAIGKRDLAEANKLVAQGWEMIEAARGQVSDQGNQLMQAGQETIAKAEQEIESGKQMLSAEGEALIVKGRETIKRGEDLIEKAHRDVRTRKEEIRRAEANAEAVEKAIASARGRKLREAWERYDEAWRHIGEVKRAAEKAIEKGTAQIKEGERQKVEANRLIAAAPAHISDRGKAKIQQGEKLVAEGREMIERGSTTLTKEAQDLLIKGQRRVEKGNRESAEARARIKRGRDNVAQAQAAERSLRFGERTEAMDGWQVDEKTLTRHYPGGSQMSRRQLENRAILDWGDDIIKRINSGGRPGPDYLTFREEVQAHKEAVESFRQIYRPW